MPRRPKQTTQADPFDLYQRSVQAPEGDIAFFLRVARRHRLPTPRLLREDFCGTAHLATTWVGGSRNRRAVGVDLDPVPLAWGRKHNVEALPPEARRRLRLIEADVREVRRPRVDIVCALNFSYCIFKRRDELRDYFRAVFRSLAAGGLLFLELYGGTDAEIPLEERRPCDGFTYVWDQDVYDPISHDTRCYIHFEFPDGSRLERAFDYDWRLWSIPEVRELLAEAGFRASEVYWEQTDDDGEGTGEFRLTQSAENQEGWIVYVVGLR
ncbi:MAG: methyltransferase domain-containing protein [Thermoanaerobaculia bacterium]